MSLRKPAPIPPVVSRSLVLRLENVVKLPGVDLSEAQIVARAASLDPAMPFNAFVKKALLTGCLRLLSQHQRSSAIAHDAPPEDRRGQLGAADGRIASVYEQLQADGRPITISKLRDGAGTGLRTVKTWAARHHPELLRKIQERPLTGQNKTRQKRKRA